MNNILALLIGIPPLFLIVVLGLVTLRSKRLADREKLYRAARGSRSQRAHRRFSGQRAKSRDELHERRAREGEPKPVSGRADARLQDQAP